MVSWLIGLSWPVVLDWLIDWVVGLVRGVGWLADWYVGSFLVGWVYEFLG